MPSTTLLQVVLSVELSQQQQSCCIAVTKTLLSSSMSPQAQNSIGSIVVMLSAAPAA